MMQRRKLGREGLEVSAEGLGCMGMSEFYGDARDDQSISTIHRVLELGVDDLAEDDYRRRSPRSQGEAFEANLEVVQRVEEIAREKGVTAGQLALAWVLHQGVVPIPGTKRVEYLEENVAAAGIELTVDELERIDEAAPPGSTQGDRYADMSTVGR